MPPSPIHRRRQGTTPKPKESGGANSARTCGASKVARMQVMCLEIGGDNKIFFNFFFVFGIDSSASSLPQEGKGNALAREARRLPAPQPPAAREQCDFPMEPGISAVWGKRTSAAILSAWEAGVALPAGAFSPLPLLLLLLLLLLPLLLLLLLVAGP